MKNFANNDVEGAKNFIAEYNCVCSPFFFPGNFNFFTFHLCRLFSDKEKKGSTLNMCDEDAGEACVELRWGNGVMAS